MKLDTQVLAQLAAGDYEAKGYLDTLHKAVGSAAKNSPSTLSDEDLVSLGKTVQKEFKRISIGANDYGDLLVTTALNDIEKVQDADSFLVQSKFVTDLVEKIDRIGYALRYQTGVGHRDQQNELTDEQYYMLRQIRALPDEYSDELHSLWATYANAVLKKVHHWNGDEDYLHQWLHQLRKEFLKRQPGYVEPEPTTGFESMTAEDFWTEEDELNEPEYSDEQIEIWGLEEALREYQISADMMNIRYDRLERIALGEVEASKEEILKLREDNRNITSSKYVNNAGWRPSDKENIRLLTQVAKPEGHSFPVQFKDNDHFKRNLCLRYGINLTNRDQALFHCTRLAWANNYWGRFKGHEDKGEVIISLWVNGQNKGEADVPDYDSDDAYDYFFDYEIAAKTTLIAKQHGDKYLELERRYAPLSADFTGYHVEQLLQAHKLIMAGLNE